MFICPYSSFASKWIPFRLCNAVATFQICMMLILSNMVENTLEVFMNKFSIVEDLFDD